MFCNKCGTKLEKDTVFCPECGNKVLEEVTEKETGTEANAEGDESFQNEKVANVQEANEQQEEAENALVISAPGTIEKIKYCGNCGNANAESDGFCHSCGMALDGSVKEGSGKKKAGKLFGGKGIFLIAGVVAIAAVVCLMVAIGGLNKNENLVYIKDNSIMEYTKKEPIEIGDSAYETKEASQNLNGGVKYEIQTSEDGKLLFYPQDYNGFAFDLYYKEVADKKGEGEKIDSNVTQYMVLKNNKVVYIKDSEEPKLYISDLKEKQKISSDVVWFRVSADEKDIFWYSSEGGKMYICDLALKEDKIKLDSDVQQVIYVSDDLKNIVYTNEKGLYCISDMEEHKIDSEISASNVVEDGDNVEIYYTVSDEEAFTYGDAIRDDYAKQDAAMTEPRIEDYQTTEIQPSFWGDREVVVTDDSYYTDYEEYVQKLYRDEYREYFSTELYQKETIYRYVPGMEESEEFASGIITSRTGYSAPVFIYGKINEEKIDKVNLSDLMESDYYSIEEDLEEKIEEARELYLVKNGEEVLLDIDTEDYSSNLYLAAYNQSEGVCYLALEENSDEYTWDLFKVNYGKMDGVLEHMASDFSNVEMTTEDGIYYLVEAENGCGELYLNDEEIESDVKMYSVMQLGDKKGILYLADMNDDLNEGTLYKYNGSESVRIADDVVDYDSNAEGEIVYLTDYSFKKWRGDLKKYKKKDAILVDDDVTSILYY